MRKWNKISILFALLLSLFCSFEASAQRKSGKVKLADQLVEDRNLFEAIDLYLKEIVKNEGNGYVMLQLAKTYREIGDYSNAEKWYENLYLLQDPKFDEAEYFYAEILHQNGKYRKAKEHYTSFGKGYKGSKMSYYRKIVKQNIKACDIALKPTTLKRDITIEKLNPSINKRYSELSPKIFGDTMLVFATLPNDTLIKINFEAPIPKIRLYYATATDSGWSPPLPFLPTVFSNLSGNIANADFSEENQRLYFTECKRNLDGKNVCKIWYTDLNSGSWSTPNQLGIGINDAANQFSSTHPSVSIDKKTGNDWLIFSSNRPGGEGGMDLYHTIIGKDGVNSNVTNLGKKINTSQNEVTPSFDTERSILYYSSNGGMGYGGYDIYASKKKGRSFRKAENLANGFNTGRDELYFSYISETEGLYTANSASNPEGCCDDIYRFTDLPKRYLLVTVYEKQDSIEAFVKEADVKITSNDSSISYPNGPIFFKADITGKYFISVNKEGYLGATAEVDFNGFDGDTLRQKLTIEKIEQGKEYRLNNLYFDYNKAELRNESKEELEKLLALLQENPKIIIEIGAHTDNVGSEDYNLELSGKRAESVKNYLLTAGIAEERLIAKGYGMSEPIAANTNPDGSDNPDGRQMNRRIVFKIIGELNEGNEVK